MTRLKWWWYCLRTWPYRLAERLRWKIAWLVPRSIALLVFVRVYSASHKEAPGPEYCRAHDEWMNGAGR